MTGKRGMLVLLPIVMVMAAGGVATLTSTSPQVATQIQTAPASYPDLQPADACGPDSPDSIAAPCEGGSDKVPPGCCSTQCNVDKDCDKRCGKGVCACIQETPCCRRCVY
ncbi:MAG TPA: hypothetical protein VFW45_06030 [Candidatus Polarisedimenticolia bacterium]|nr:hypothetical protein [Candidatus Polarisedimenticolia bacterium]